MNNTLLLSNDKCLMTNLQRILIKFSTNEIISKDNYYSVYFYRLYWKCSKYE
ncbi:hypothetical protein FPC831_250024 [Flavobacterium psychrophilum]|nr:hypothetical protein FPC831_250024 [Flavobacterium psychrophilum]SNB95786.1 hypothetical protein FPC840_1680001 [Flavobacterium psychrophilum]